MDVSKLPKWAQEYIDKLDRERFVAVRALNEFMDSQKQSDVWTEDYVCTGEQVGPMNKRHYFQTHRVSFRVGKSKVEARLMENGTLRINIGDKLTMMPVSYGAIEVGD